MKENEGDREAATEVALLFGYLKNADKNEFIVQKAVELGVKKLIAFSSEFSSAYMNENKLERLNKVSRDCLLYTSPDPRRLRDVRAGREKNRKRKFFQGEAFRAKRIRANQ